jgi:hypothetical protein
MQKIFMETVNKKSGKKDGGYTLIFKFTGE